MDNSIALLQTQLHPKYRDLVLQAHALAVKNTPVGVHPNVNQVLRPWSQQEQYYALGRTVRNPDGASASKPLGNIITYALPGHSFHQYGLAVDYNMLINGEVSWDIDDNFMIIVAAYKSLGFRWGGNFPQGEQDPPHFEIGNLSTNTMTQMYLNKDFIPGTEWLNL